MLYSYLLVLNLCRLEAEANLFNGRHAPGIVRRAKNARPTLLGYTDPPPLKLVHPGKGGLNP
jgi:hypothetical protein